MIHATKEILWHLNCNKCDFTWTMSTNDDKLCINRGEKFCPQCGTKQLIKER